MDGPPTPSLVGTWTKTAAAECAERYPQTIEFGDVRYLGRKGLDQGFIVWDAGVYSVLGPDRVRISTAWDEQVVYEFRLEGDDLTFRDEAGCEVTYRLAR